MPILYQEGFNWLFIHIFTLTLCTFAIDIAYLGDIVSDMSLLKSRISLGKFVALSRRPLLTAVRTIATTPNSTVSTPVPNANGTTLHPSYSKSMAEVLKGKVLADEDYSSPEIYAKHPRAPGEIDWSTSWFGLGAKPFSDDVQKQLLTELKPEDIEIKPDGMIYLPEIKYRRILNKAFGAGGWGMVPRSETIVTDSLVTREYGLICHGQLVSVARGEQDYFNTTGIPTATEGCKSNALMRCCKDLGIGSELWDPVFTKSFRETYCVEKFVEHITTKKKKKIWIRKDRKVEYPYK